MTQAKRFIQTQNIWRRWLSVFILGLFGFTLMVGSMGLSGCSSDGSDASGETGEVVIGLTDGEGDFVRYAVDVLSITLTKASGAVVETLPLSTQVDFAQYTEMTEFFTIATIPSGVYTGATLTLDYQEADIWAENASGEAVKVETIQDENGNEILTLDVSVHLQDAHSLLIAPGIPAHLTLDFDLNTSNKVEFEGSGSPVLTVQPVLLADVNPERPKIHRLRGPLKDVDVDEGIFSVIIRPFFHILSIADERFGILEVVTSQSTVYDINGDLYKGEDGLIALDDMPVHTATVVIGDLKFNPIRFEARQVYAGSSVPGGTLDVVAGNVISRDDNEVTIKGATLIRADGSVVFHNTVMIQLGQNTRVVRQLSTDDHDIDDISVGQSIRVFGTLNDEMTELDATDGYAHMLLTTLRGEVVDVGTPWFVIDLMAIDGRRFSIFDFEGTGTDTEHDADPANYGINSGNLDLSSLSFASPVKVLGFVKAFGDAPEDFNAQTIVDLSNVNALMKVNWHPATLDAFDVSAESITINLGGVRHFHHVWRSGVVIDLKDLSASPLIMQREGGQGLFSIDQNGITQLHFTFESFITDLKERLAEDARAKNIVARGTFDDIAATMTTDHVSVRLR